MIDFKQQYGSIAGNSKKPVWVQNKSISIYIKTW